MDWDILFHTEETERLKLSVCEIGKRMWQRGYVDGNGGNISIRLDDQLILCTPTYISKGFMKPEDLCLVDWEGKTVAGVRRCTSEIKTHLAVMKNNPAALACVHAHPPYITSYALCGMLPPAGVIAEAEIFLGDIGLAPYATPGSSQIEDSVGELSPGKSAIIMQGHGAITWAKTLEEAYWKMENLEAYCQVVHLAACRGDRLQTFTEEQKQELKDLRKKFES